MNIYEMTNRTKTYLAGDWTGDKDLIKKIQEWNTSNRFGLNFVDVHELTSSNDGSLNCSIKASLRARMNISKTFVLVVGKNTKSLRSGACFCCSRYRIAYNGSPYCLNSQFNSIDNRSFVQYECEMALKDYNDGKLKNIVVIYNGRTTPDKSLCPDCLKNVGIHIGSDVINGGKRCWNYQVIKKQICG